MQAKLMRHRLAIIVSTYIALFTTSLFLAVCLRFDFSFARFDREWLVQFLPAVIAVKFFWIAVLGESKRSFRHATITDAVVSSAVCVLSCAVLMVGHFAESWTGLVIPRSVVLIDMVLSLLFMSGFRIVCRMIWAGKVTSERSKPREPTLIYGVDESSIGIWKMVIANNGHLGRYRIVGFIDPNPKKLRSLIGGLRIYNLEECMNSQIQNTYQHILVPTITEGRVVRELLEKTRETNVKVHNIPTVDEIVEGRFQLKVRDLDIDDLLRRPATQLDLDSISQTITGKSVMVTGGAGSIGSELCRQILSFEPKKLVIFDHSEFGVFQMEQEFTNRDDLKQTEISYIASSILDRIALNQTFQEYKPDVVFHAAAYKHVPLMQDNAYAAIRNNFLGTKAVVDASSEHLVQKFVLISTDKAVRPTSVMGATKLLAEKYLQAISSHSETNFITVRFGNVLNSVGSVVPTFRKQIEKGGPITVTHPEMVRYFMTIPEAVQLVLQSGAIGQSGNVFILDMDEPVKIVDLAKDMISLSGLSYPNDIDIEFVGLRPGEKMYEELFYEHEKQATKVHEKIILGSAHAPSVMQINSEIQTLKDSFEDSSMILTSRLWDIVQHYVELDNTAASNSQSSKAA